MNELLHMHKQLFHFGFYYVLFSFLFVTVSLYAIFLLRQIVPNVKSNNKIKIVDKCVLKGFLVAVLSSIFCFSLYGFSHYFSHGNVIVPLVLFFMSFICGFLYFTYKYIKK